MGKTTNRPEACPKITAIGAKKNPEKAERERSNP
jgi:hypothetical protein